MPVDVPVGPIVTEGVLLPVLLAPADPEAVLVSVGVPVGVLVCVEVRDAVPVSVRDIVPVPLTGRVREIVELKE